MKRRGPELQAGVGGPFDPLTEAMRLERAGLVGEAERVLREAASARPSVPAYHRELARVLRARREYAGAEASARRAVRLAARDLEAAILLAQILQDTGKTKEARESFERAIWLAPKDPRAYCGIAVMLEKSREVDAAMAMVERALAAAPEHQLAHVLRARLLRRLGRLEEARADAEAFLAAPDRHPEARKRMAYELSRILDRLGDYDGAFGAAALGNAIQRELPDAKAAYTTSWFPIFDALSHVTAAQAARWAAERTVRVQPAPVFLVGFPRSGTTMLEQILSTHPRIVATNEREVFHHAMRVLSRGLDDIQGWAAHLDAMPEAQVEEARAAYLGACDEILREQPGATIVLDKFPMHLGVVMIINRVFPEARILVSHRDPRDVCLSSFLQEFVPNRSMVHFLSLDDTVRVYELMMGAWLRQRDRVSAPVLEVKYEDITRDLETSARRVLEFCGVDWDPAVLRFHEREHQRWVSTPSYEAISRPVNTDAQGRWKKYRANLEAVLPRLEPFVRALGYEPTGGA